MQVKSNGGNAKVVTDAQGVDPTLWEPRTGGPNLLNENRTAIENEGANLYAAKIVDTTGFDIESISGEGFIDNFARIWVNGTPINIT